MRRAAIILLLAFGLPACQKSSAPPGGVLVFAVPAEFAAELRANTLPPEEKDLFPRFVEAFVRQPLRELAELSPERTDDGWILTLPDDARFHSGKRVTSADVVASYRGEEIPGLVRIVAVGDDRVRLVVSDRAPTLPMLTNVFIRPASQTGNTSLEDLDGTSPFRVRHVGTDYVLLEHTSHRRVARTLEGVVLEAFGDTNGMWGGMVKGEADLAYSHLGRTEGLDTLPFLQRLELPSPYLHMMLFNCKEQKVADPRIRRALSYAVNRTELIDRYYEGQAIPMASFSERKDPFDLARAHELLEAAGVDDGSELEIEALVAQNEPQLVAALQAARLELSEVHVNMTIRALSYEEISSRHANGDYEVIGVGLRTRPFWWTVEQLQHDQSFASCATQDSQRVLGKLVAAAPEQTRAERDDEVARIVELSRPAVFLWRRSDPEYLHVRVEGIDVNGGTLFEQLGDVYVPGRARLERDSLDWWLDRAP